MASNRKTSAQSAKSAKPAPNRPACADPVKGLIGFVRSTPLGIAERSILTSLLLLPRGQAGDLVDIGAIDADVLQFVIRIVGQLLDDAPVRPTGA